MSQFTVQQAFDLACRHHQAGRFQEAEQLYRRILAEQPAHVDAMHSLGLLAHQVGRNDIAADLIRRVVAFQPNNDRAYVNLGNALHAAGRFDEAIAAYRQAIALSPNLPDAHSNLGNTLKNAGQLDQAIAACRQAIVLSPNLPEAHNNLANALEGKGQLDEAIAAYRRAIALRPNYAKAHNNLGSALQDKGELDDAIAAYRQAVTLNPNFPEANNNLGNALTDKGQFTEAIAAYRQAIAHREGYADAYSNLANALKENGQFNEAADACRQAIILKPTLPEAHSHLGNAVQGMGQPDEAIAAYRQAIALKPDYAGAYNNLGNVLRDMGQLVEGIAAYRQAIALKPDYAEAGSNLIFTLHYDPGCDAQAIVEEKRRWNRQHAQPLRPLIQPHPNDRNPGRRLRIGYVSPNFCTHPVGRFLLPLLACHDRGAFEVFCYAQVPLPDEMTARLKGHADAWRNTVGLSDEQMAQMIRRDRIDVLVDLAMHTAGNRLLVFARKPAPVQVTYLAYAGGTGLDAIDYRLTDRCLDPDEADDGRYMEKSIRLEGTYWCYQQIIDTPPANELPALTSHAVTFGCLNNFCKINDAVLSLWALVLKSLPGSRLLLLAPRGSSRQRTLDQLASNGIAPERVEFTEKQPLLNYLETYHRMDIALDPFPYGGGTTTCDALWMGVPVVTLAGRTAVGRAGVSLLTHAGLPELIAQRPDEYVRLAADLAKDLPKLSELRSTLRQRMEQSPLMDGPKFARNVEAAHRRMWRNWRQAAV